MDPKCYFVIVKMVRPDTCTGWSDIKTDMETTSISQWNNDTPKNNLHIF